MPFQKKPTNYNDEHKERFVFLLSFGTFDLFGCFTGHLVVHLLIFIGYETILCHNASCNLSQTFIAAITTVVTIAEILKKNGLAIEKSKNLHLLILKSFSILDECEYFDTDCLWNKAEVLTSTVGTKDDNKGRVVQKAKVGLDSYHLYSLLLDVETEYTFILISIFPCLLF